jgi:hypothetical protein
MRQGPERGRAPAILGEDPYVSALSKLRTASTATRVAFASTKRKYPKSRQNDMIIQLALASRNALSAMRLVCRTIPVRVAATIEGVRRSRSKGLALGSSASDSGEADHRQPGLLPNPSLLPTPHDTRIAWLFPGQGAQQVGMGKDLFEQSPAASRLFEAADSILGRPLSRLCFEGPEDELRLTQNPSGDNDRRSRLPRRRARARTTGMRALLCRRPQPRRVHGRRGSRGTLRRRRFTARARARTADGAGGRSVSGNDGGVARPG